MVPTPTKEGGEHWSHTDSVDLEVAADMIERMIQAGIGSIAACGTTGECAALLWEEKRGFIDTVVQVNRGRVPVFAGATALGTKEVIRQMRAFKEIGADAAFVGLPLWQTPTLENSVQFYSDLGEAMPDMPVMVYANPNFFKSNFPTPFWAGIGRKAPTVIASKDVYAVPNLLDNLQVTGGRVNFLPIQRDVYPAYYRLAGSQVTALWATMVGLGPEPIIALMDAVLQGDAQRAEEVVADMKSVPGAVPPSQSDLMPQYNAQIINAASNAAGYVKVGPPRAPYADLPESWQKQAAVSGKAWAEMRKKYIKTPTETPTAG